MIRNLISLICAASIVFVGALSGMMESQQAPTSTGQQTPASSGQQAPAANGQQAPGSDSQEEKLSNDQLDSLVAQIALYPDQLLSQTLVASTYPLEIVQLQQFLDKHKDLKDKALTDAVAKQNWDPSVQAMAAFPTLVKQLAENISWTDSLGNAFLAQQSDVMDAVQRMRKKAMDKGALKSTDEQKVETKVVENKTVVVVQPTSTEVVYVPSYSPVAVWGAPYYPYPVMAYPWYAPTGGRLLAFGTGVAIGAAWGGGGWGWNAGWGGHNDININRNNTFVNNSGARGNRYGGANGTWQHNPQHRGGAPYGNRATAQQYGGAARGDNLSQRQSTARQNAGARQNSAAANNFRNSGAASNRAGSAQGGNLGGGGDRIGSRQTSNGSMGSRNSSALSGSSGSAARASSARGSSSMGGGGARMGGGRGGGGRRR